MKPIMTFFFFTIIACSIGWSNELTEDFVTGNPDIQSIHALTFGPESILFIGDSDAAQIVAIDLSNQSIATNEDLAIEDLEAQLSNLLGTTSDQFQVIDLAVDPANENIYIAVNHSSGKSLLFLVNNNTLEPVPIEEVSYSKTALNNAVSVEAQDRRGRSLRKWAISDLRYADGKVMVSGLSNAEFASTFRALTFPFSDKEMQSSLEIYHAAHGKYETHSPIKTFTPVTINGKSQILASYTCTPLVVFPLDELKNGEHTKGRTVAELGNWNTPLDIIEMEKEGKRYILMANTNRAVMKIKVSDIESFGESLSEKVVERAGTAGIDFVNLPFVNVQQLDKLNESTFVMIQRQADGVLALKTSNNRWL
jgi:hypothetical protein